MALLLLYLSGPGLAQPGSALSPPGDGTILVTRQSALRFHWDPGWRVELWNRGHMQALPTLDGEASFNVSPGQSYTWRAYLGTRLIQEACFSVTDRFEYRSQGRDGQNGQRLKQAQDGKAGTDGGNLRVDLSRQGPNLNLLIEDQGRLYRYLLADQSPKFLISVRGGCGGQGSDGLDQQGPQAAQAGNGGASGWGGHIEMTVHQLPWREALELDVSPGVPGNGGRGGQDQGTSSEGDPVHTKYPDGRPGAAGRPGTVTTHIQP
ncbi:MAG: hypothetical protein U0931_08085 [Vulcanimicrobiota bacterium]